MNTILCNILIRRYYFVTNEYTSHVVKDIMGCNYKLNAWINFKN